MCGLKVYTLYSVRRTNRHLQKNELVTSLSNHTLCILCQHLSALIAGFHCKNNQCGQGEISEAFPLLQEVRQGGVLSPHFYKIIS